MAEKDDEGREMYSRLFENEPISEDLLDRVVLPMPSSLEVKLQKLYEDVLLKNLDLEQRLASIENENGALQSKNSVLRNNIQAIIQTFNFELRRRDAQIAALKKQLQLKTAEHGMINNFSGFSSGQEHIIGLDQLMQPESKTDNVKPVPFQLELGPERSNNGTVSLDDVSSLMQNKAKDQNLLESSVIEKSLTSHKSPAGSLSVSDILSSFDFGHHSETHSSTDYYRNNCDGTQVPGNIRPSNMGGIGFRKDPNLMKSSISGTPYGNLAGTGNKNCVDICPSSSFEHTVLSEDHMKRYTEVTESETPSRSTGDVSYTCRNWNVLSTNSETSAGICELRLETSVMRNQNSYCADNSGMSCELTHQNSETLAATDCVSSGQTVEGHNSKNLDSHNLLREQEKAATLATRYLQKSSNDVAMIGVSAIGESTATTRKGIVDLASTVEQKGLTASNSSRNKYFCENKEPESVDNKDHDINQRKVSSVTVKSNSNVQIKQNEVCNVSCVDSKNYSVENLMPKETSCEEYQLNKSKQKKESDVLNDIPANTKLKDVISSESSKRTKIHLDENSSLSDESFPVHHFKEKHTSTAKSATRDASSPFSVSDKKYCSTDKSKYKEISSSDEVEKCMLKESSATNKTVPAKLKDVSQLDSAGNSTNGVVGNKRANESVSQDSSLKKTKPKEVDSSFSVKSKKESSVEIVKKSNSNLSTSSSVGVSDADNLHCSSKCLPDGDLRLKLRNSSSSKADTANSERSAKSISGSKSHHIKKSHEQEKERHSRKSQINRDRSEREDNLVSDQHKGLRTNDAKWERKEEDSNRARTEDKNRKRKRSEQDLELPGNKSICLDKIQERLMKLSEQGDHILDSSTDRFNKHSHRQALSKNHSEEKLLLDITHSETAHNTDVPKKIEIPTGLASEAGVMQCYINLAQKRDVAQKIAQKEAQKHLSQHVSTPASHPPVASEMETTTTVRPKNSSRPIKSTAESFSPSLSVFTLRAMEKRKQAAQETSHDSTQIGSKTQGPQLSDTGFKGLKKVNHRNPQSKCMMTSQSSHFSNNNKGDKMDAVQPQHDAIKSNCDNRIQTEFEAAKKQNKSHVIEQANVENAKQLNAADHNDEAAGCIELSQDLRLGCALVPAEFEVDAGPGGDIANPATKLVSMEERLGQQILKLSTLQQCEDMSAGKCQMQEHNKNAPKSSNCTDSCEPCNSIPFSSTPVKMNPPHSYPESEVNVTVQQLDDTSAICRNGNASFDVETINNAVDSHSDLLFDVAITCVTMDGQITNENDCENVDTASECDCYEGLESVQTDDIFDNNHLNGSDGHAMESKSDKAEGLNFVLDNVQNLDGSEVMKMRKQKCNDLDIWCDSDSAESDSNEESIRDEDALNFAQKDDSYEEQEKNDCSKEKEQKEQTENSWRQRLGEQVTANSGVKHTIQQDVSDSQWPPTCDVNLSLDDTYNSLCQFLKVGLQKPNAPSAANHSNSKDPNLKLQALTETVSEQGVTLNDSVGHSLEVSDEVNPCNISFCESELLQVHASEDMNFDEIHSDTNDRLFGSISESPISFRSVVVMAEAEVERKTQGMCDTGVVIQGSTVRLSPPEEGEIEEGEINDSEKDISSNSECQTRRNVLTRKPSLNSHNGKWTKRPSFSQRGSRSGKGFYSRSGHQRDAVHKREDIRSSCTTAERKELEEGRSSLKRSRSPEMTSDLKFSKNRHRMKRVDQGTSERNDRSHEPVLERSRDMLHQHKPRHLSKGRQQPDDRFQDKRRSTDGKRHTRN